MGGVSDYTQMVARGLVAAGDEVHVWCPPASGDASRVGTGETSDVAGVFVHRELGKFAPADLRRAGSLLDQFSAPRRLLVQWVPHGYGYQSMNLPFCWWLWRRAARRHDAVEVMVHEPYLAFGEGNWKQSGAAVVHRLMAMMLLRAARRIWMSIPAWEESLRPYALGRTIPFQWLPVMSNIAVVDDPAGVSATRSRYVHSDGQLIGHFGTYDRNITELLLKTVPALLDGGSHQAVLFMGRGSESAREELLSQQPELTGRIYATGMLASHQLSLHISACDVLLQPYIDGVSSRRTSVMVGLSHSMPIVTTSGRLTESLWAESEAVALAPAEDVGALVESVQRLLSDETRRRRMSTAARALYEERFAVRRTINALREAVA